MTKSSILFIVYMKFLKLHLLPILVTALLLSCGGPLGNLASLDWPEDMNGRYLYLGGGQSPTDPGGNNIQGGLGVDYPFLSFLSFHGGLAIRGVYLEADGNTFFGGDLGIRANIPKPICSFIGVGLFAGASPDTTPLDDIYPEIGIHINIRKIRLSIATCYHVMTLGSHQISGILNATYFKE